MGALNVAVTADIVDLQQKFAVAKAETSSLGSEMHKLAKQAAAGTLDTAGQSTFAQLAQQYLTAKNSAASYSAQLKETSDSTRSLGESIDEARGKLSTLFQISGAAAAYEAIRQVIGLVSQFGERAQQVNNMADVLSVTTAQYQAMGVAAEEAGVGQEAFYRAAERLNTTLTEAHDGSGTAIASLRALGLTAQQANDQSFGLIPTLQVIHDRLNNTGTATSEMNELTRVLGARAALAAEAMKQFDGSAASVAAIMAKINGLSDEQIAALSHSSSSWHEFTTWVENSGSKLLLMSENALKAEGTMLAAFHGIATGQTALQLATAMNSKGNADNSPQIGQIQRLAAVAQSTYPQITAAVLQSEQAQVEAAATGTAQRVALAQKYYQDSQQFYGNSNVTEVQAAYREMASAQKEFTAAHLVDLREEASAAAQKDRDDVASYRESLQQMKEASKEFDTIERQNAATDIQIQRDSVAAKKAILESEIADTATASAAKFATLRALVNQEYELDQEALQNELTGLEDQPAAYNRVYNEIRELKAKQVAELAQLDQQAAAAARRAAQQDSQGWKDGVREIESAESTLVGDLVSRRKSLSASLVQISAQFVQQEIANDLKAMTTKLLLASNEANSEKALEQGGLLYHILTQNELSTVTVTAQKMQTQAVIAGNQARTAATASAAAAGTAQETASATQTITTDAGKAFSGVFSGVSQIPYGWIIAPALAAAAESTVMTHLEVGTAYVPQDMPAYLHRGEMVMPKPMADTVRAGGFGGGAEQTAGGDIHLHQSFSGIDGASMMKMATSPQFHQALAAAARLHFGRGGR